MGRPGRSLGDTHLPVDRRREHHGSHVCSTGGAACSERRADTASSSKFRHWPSICDLLSSQSRQHLGRRLGGVPVRRADLADRPGHPTVLALEDHIPRDVEVSHVDALPGRQLLQHGREILSRPGAGS